jgi:tetratricopeptide (TPR) repeat protein
MTVATTEAESPLELYRRAFVFHMRENKVREAVELYRDICKRFPESEAAAYATIQLARIEADPSARRLSRRVTPGTIVLFSGLIISLVVCAVLSVLWFATNAELRHDKENNAQIARALGKMYQGADDAALEILRDLKVTARGNVAPYALSAEIFQAKNNYLKARREYEIFRRLYPNDATAIEELSTINSDEDAFINEAVTSSPHASTPEEIVSQTDTVPLAHSKTSKTTKQIPVREKVVIQKPAKAPAKSIKHSDRSDSISFF